MQGCLDAHGIARPTALQGLQLGEPRRDHRPDGLGGHARRVGEARDVKQLLAQLLRRFRRHGLLRAARARRAKAVPGGSARRCRIRALL